MVDIPAFCYSSTFKFHCEPTFNSGIEMCNALYVHFSLCQSPLYSSSYLHINDIEFCLNIAFSIRAVLEFLFIYLFANVNLSFFLMTK